MSPIFPKCGSTIFPLSKDQGTNFGKDLVEYLTTYKLPSVDEWIEIINGHDLSVARFLQITFERNWNDLSKLQNFI